MSKIEDKAKEIFAGLDADGFASLRSGYFPTELVAHLSGEGFGPDEVGAVGRALIRMSNAAVAEQIRLNSPESVEEGVYLPLLREVARLRHVLGIRPPVSQGTYHEERHWDITMEMIDKLIAAADGVEYKKPLLFKNIRGLHPRMGG